jgi:hypothetical protein
MTYRVKTSSSFRCDACAIVDTFESDRGQDGYSSGWISITAYWRDASIGALYHLCPKCAFLLRGLLNLPAGGEPEAP